jgi:hypothetical protein
VYANKNKSDINNVCYISSTEYNTDNGDNKNNRCSIVFGEKSVPDTLVSVEDGVGGEGIGVVDVEELMPEPSGVQVFSYTGAPQEFIVPDRVKEVKIVVWGAQGGGTKGGLGGKSWGILEVSSGQKLYVYVGQQGGSATVAGGYGGWNGGGFGGALTRNGAVKNHGGGGGGGTDVRTTQNDAYQNRVIVA